MLFEMFASRTKTLVFPFMITQGGGEQGQNAGLITKTANGFVAFAFIYVGF